MSAIVILLLFFSIVISFLRFGEKVARRRSLKVATSLISGLLGKRRIHSMRVRSPESTRRRLVQVS